MAASDIVLIQVSTNSRTPIRQGFGRLCALSYHAVFPELYRLYTDTADMLTDGFVATDAAYLQASAAFSQNPRPADIMIGRLAVAHAQTVALTCTTATTGERVTFEVRGTGGTWVQIDYLIPGSSTTTTVATDVEILVEAVTGVDSTSSAAVITAVPTTGGKVLYFRGSNGALPRNITIKDNTPAALYDTALTNLLAANPDFYFVAVDVPSVLNIAPVAVWAEANKRIFFFQTQNTEEANGTGTLFTTQQTAGRVYTAGFFSHDGTQFVDCAAAGLGCKDPGTFTWALKAMAGVNPVLLTTTQESNLRTNGAMWVGTIARGVYGILGKNNGGYSCGGTPLDLTHGTDALKARMQEDLITVLANQDKVDYTDADLVLVENSMLGSLAAFTGPKRLLASGTTSVSLAAVADQSPTDKGNRYFPGAKFAGTYAGAVQKIKIVGTLSV